MAEQLILKGTLEGHVSFSLYLALPHTLIIVPYGTYSGTSTFAILCRCPVPAVDAAGFGDGGDDDNDDDNDDNDDNVNDNDHKIWNPKKKTTRNLPK